MNRPVIFTDLDGTLLDASSYSFQPAEPALRRLQEGHIPLILCSSKTRPEIEYYRELLNNSDPFISENGGGIFIPGGYIDPVHFGGLQTEESGNYTLVRLGAPYAELRSAVKVLKGKGFAVRGFGDMTVREISELTGLSGKEAAMAGERDFDEPFILEGGQEMAKALLDAIRELGFRTTQGRFFHLMGGSDKGRAVSILLGLLRNQFGPVSSAALGDSPNDLPMLEQVDAPIIVQKPGGQYDAAFSGKGFTLAGGIGPEGWNLAVLSLLHDRRMYR